MHSSTSLVPAHAPSFSTLPRDLLATPRPANFVRKALEKERYAIVTDVLYMIVFPAIAWLVLARGFHLGTFAPLAVSGGIFLAALWYLIGDVRALRGAIRLVRDGVAARGRVIGSIGFMLEASFPGVDGNELRALFLPTLMRKQGESVAVIHLPERDELLAVTERGIVAGIKRSRF